MNIHRLILLSILLRGMHGAENAGRRVNRGHPSPLAVHEPFLDLGAENKKTSDPHDDLPSAPSIFSLNAWHEPAQVVAISQIQQTEAKHKYLE